MPNDANHELVQWAGEQLQPQTPPAETPTPMHQAAPIAGQQNAPIGAPPTAPPAHNTPGPQGPAMIQPPNPAWPSYTRPPPMAHDYQTDVWYPPGEDPHSLAVEAWLAENPQYRDNDLFNQLITYLLPQATKSLGHG